MSAGQQFSEPFKRISVAQAKEMMDAGEVTVIDVREPWEYERGHVPGAKLVPLAKIIANPRENVQVDNVVFVCEVGQRSAVAAEFAASLGRQNLYNLEGGTSEWRKQGMPVE